MAYGQVVTLGVLGMVFALLHHGAHAGNNVTALLGLGLAAVVALVSLSR